MSRLPTTTASVTEYWSSSSRGAYGQVFMSVICSPLKRWEYQTFHSSKEMLMVLFAVQRGLHGVRRGRTGSMNASMSTAEARKLPGRRRGSS